MTGYSGPEVGRDVSRFVGADLREVSPPGAEVVVVEGTTGPVEHLRGPGGSIRAGALLTIMDNVAGICGGLAALPDGWVVSTNLMVRRVRLDDDGPLVVTAETLRRGRSSVVTSVRAVQRAGAVIADGVLTSAVLVPENGPPRWDRPVSLRARDGRPDDEVRPPLHEWLHLAATTSGEVEVPLADRLRNPWGIAHGGVIASVADAAGERAVASVAGAGVATSDVVLHFLAPGRAGPIRGRAEVLGARADGWVTRVSVHDAGAGDRRLAVAITTVRAVSTAPAG